MNTFRASTWAPHVTPGILIFPLGNPFVLILPSQEGGKEEGGELKCMNKTLVNKPVLNKKDFVYVRVL